MGNKLLVLLRNSRGMTLIEIAQALDLSTNKARAQVELGIGAGLVDADREGVTSRFYISPAGILAILPTIGMVCTESVGSDRYAHEIIEVRSNGTLLIRQMHSRRTDSNGMSEVQTWESEPNADAPIAEAKRGRDRRWRTDRDTLLSLGVHAPYRDPSF